MSFQSACAFALCLYAWPAQPQPFFFGADLSYVNEMEDCGVVYQEQGVARDPYQIFADHHCNLVRLRLWHTPAWYDGLNAGQRYSDLQDVRTSIGRAKSLGMKVLLDFHLSDNWADPGRQIVPAAWLGVVNNLPLLQDSLYNYVSQTLLHLDADGLLPEMVQIGNETNKGILLSPAVDAAGWSLDWSRNSQLFNRAIQAIRDVETATGKKIQVALHIAGPANADWLMQGFWSHGVTDFDIIGLSYYWAFHKPTTIQDAGNVITQLRQQYAGKEVMILETACIWTTQSNDNANNIINEVQPGYSPASPLNQQRWLRDLTQEVINKGGKGVIAWEPAWVSSSCSTQFGQGSHQENAAFFDFNEHLLPTGGINFMTYPYQNLVAAQEPGSARRLEVWADNIHHSLKLRLEGFYTGNSLKISLLSTDGRVMNIRNFQIPAMEAATLQFPLTTVLPAGIYYVAVDAGDGQRAVKGVWIGE